jgi:hypothetical protein
MTNVFYTYAYLRENGSPYYIGKGKDDRAYDRCGRVVPMPPTRERILILKRNLSEFDAFKHEMYMIDVLGRKDKGTGILRNLTNGGDGVTGFIITDERRKQLSDSTKGIQKTESHKQKIKKAHLKNPHRKGRSWYCDPLNLSLEKMCHPYEIPDGWIKGRAENNKQKMRKPKQHKSQKIRLHSVKIKLQTFRKNRI